MNEAFEKILERLRNLAENYGRLQFGFNDSCEIQKYVGMEQAVDLAIEIVQEVSKEYKGGWIPCGERLPKYGEVVMCSCTNSGITISCITHKGVKPSKSVRFGQHSVIAWQPLPEPYKERD